MGNLKNKIQEDLKNGLKNKEEVKVSTLRTLISAIHNQEIQEKKSSESLSDQEIEKVISTEIKKRKESVSFYEEAGRNELAEKEKEEIKILQTYLPPVLSDEELKEIIKEIINETDDKNFGKIMGKVMSKIQGRADGNKVSAMVKKLLG